MSVKGTIRTHRLSARRAAAALAGGLCLAIGFTAGGVDAKGSHDAGLRFRSCITALPAVASQGPCSLVSSTPGMPLNFESSAIALSSDGRSLYAVGSGSRRVMHFEQDPVSGELVFRDCETGGAPSPGPCTPIPTAWSGATGSGLYGPLDLALSRDARSLYVVSGDDHAIVTFSRDLASGSLTFRQCLTGAMKRPGVPPPAGTPSCTPVSSATEFGFDSGFRLPNGVASSRDGRSVYMSSSEGVIELARNGASGELSFQGCLSNGPASTRGPCRPVHAGTSKPRLDQTTSPVVSADDRSVYVTGPGGIVAFDRNRGTGSLAFHSCYTSMRSTRGCRRLARAGQVPTQLALSPDGDSLYGASDPGASLTEFRRDPGGRLVYRRCLSVNRITRSVCRLLPGASSRPGEPGFHGASGVVVSPDGRRVYTSALGESTIAAFTRSRSGVLRFRGCLSGQRKSRTRGNTACAPTLGATSSGRRSGLLDVGSLAVSPDSLSIYLGSGTDKAISSFRR
jgi:6-phosphogluconolactonase (cycloisomerase 2 family)